jgi:hypothetical protein
MKTWHQVREQGTNVQEVNVYAVRSNKIWFDEKPTAVASEFQICGSSAGFSWSAVSRDGHGFGKTRDHRKKLSFGVPTQPLPDQQI